MTKGALRRYRRALEEVTFENSLLLTKQVEQTSEISSLKEKLRDHRSCAKRLQDREEQLVEVREQCDQLTEDVTILERQARKAGKGKSRKS